MLTSKHLVYIHNRSFLNLHSRRPMPSTQPQLRINRQIVASQVRLVDSVTKNTEIVPLRVALERAMQANLDLVEISPATPDSPPVCKILDYSKYKYQEAQKLKSQKVQRVSLKEVQIRPGIEENDYQVKLRNTLKFLEANHKVKVIMQFRGRTLMVQQQAGKELMERFCSELGDKVKIEAPPKLEGKNLIVLLSPIKLLVKPNTSISE